MPTPRNRWIYLLVLIASTVPGALFLGVARMTIDNLACRSSHYGDGYFLAYCKSEHYGDYEHGALYYGLEPLVGHNIRRAEVVFLGSSVTQAAFSTVAVREHFAKLHVRYFVLGWGYEETSPFALAVLKKWHTSPKVLVINATPFFSEHSSGPAREVLEGTPGLLWRLMLKMMFQRVHRGLCFTAPFLCSQSKPAIFRSARDGQWHWIDPNTHERASPIDPKKQATLTRDAHETARRLGEAFLLEVGMDRQCVVLTGTPMSFVNTREFAEPLAHALKTKSIFPRADDLFTLDGIHLNLESAERWSARFLEALTPILSHCLHG